MELQKAHHIFRTKNKNLGGVGLRQEKAFLMSAGGEKLSPFVEGRTCVHYFHFLHQAEPTHLGGGSEGSGSGHGCPLYVEVDLLVLQLPNIPCEGGFHPLGAVLKYKYKYKCIHANAKRPALFFPQNSVLISSHPMH